MFCLRYCIIGLLIICCIKEAYAITCYECQSSQGQDCKYHGTTCGYGMFGCIKIAAYSGGVDKCKSHEIFDFILSKRNDK